MLAVINRIRDPRSLRVGQKLRIPNQPLRTVVEKASHLCAVYLGEVIVRLYWCSHGKPGHETPIATFTVGEKIHEPDWYFDGQIVPYGAKENPLGTHFVKFGHDIHQGFGIHGTWEPEKLGTEASLGCIRLHNQDIAEYFALVPRGTKVEIRANH